jgi:putative FmdB family regulatory protein
MPVYDRLCGSCGDLFEVTCSIAEKYEKEHECPDCGSIEGAFMIGSPTLSRHSERLMTHKKDSGFNEVISKIQERNGRTEICKR